MMQLSSASKPSSASKSSSSASSSGSSTPTEGWLLILCFEAPNAANTLFINPNKLHQSLRDALEEQDGGDYSTVLGSARISPRDSDDDSDETVNYRNETVVENAEVPFVGHVVKVTNVLTYHVQ